MTIMTTMMKMTMMRQHREKPFHRWKVIKKRIIKKRKIKSNEKVKKIWEIEVVLTTLGQVCFFFDGSVSWNRRGL